MSSHDAAVDYRDLINRVPKQLRIGGTWRDGGGGDTFAVTDPATERTLCEVADGTAQDAGAALDAAVAAQAEWAATTPRQRGEILRAAWQLMQDRADELALLCTLEMGKSLAESKGEVAYASEFFRWFSEEAVRIDGRYTPSPADANGRIVVARQPVGPCLLITPWNFPMAMGTRKIGPAIAAGCTMVVKPPQLTPLSMLNLAALLSEAGLPDGVLNVVPATSASRVVNPLMEDPRLRKVSFTGSTEVGRTLVEASAQHLQRSSMELGGNAPFVVLDDADVDASVEGAAVAKMRNNGESCVAANRFLVAESVAEEFTGKLSDKLGAMKVGHGTADGVEVGPLINADQRDAAAELVDDAVRKGARATIGGKPVEGSGFFFAPTVLADVPSHARILTEEVFAPVAPIVTFSGDDEAVRLANDTEFGLVSYLYTRDVSRAVRVGERLETGMVGINTGLVSNAAAPFGGVKESGFGREGGAEGIGEYLETKYMALNLG